MTLDIPGIADKTFPGFSQKAFSALEAAEREYEKKRPPKRYASLRSHCMRASALAEILAAKLERDPLVPAIGAALHDLGKFAGGCYHESDEPEEHQSARLAEKLLRDLGADEETIRLTSAAISDTAEPSCAANPDATIIFDSDHLDKLGLQGVAAFWVKSALRGSSLDRDFPLRFSIELTYALHAPRVLQTKPGRELAARRAVVTTGFYEDLLEEIAESGMGRWRPQKREWDGMELIIVLPEQCTCGSTEIDVEMDCRKEVKCERLYVSTECAACNHISEIAFCLPNIEKPE